MDSRLSGSRLGWAAGSTPATTAKPPARSLASGGSTISRFDPQATLAGKYRTFRLPTTYFLAGGKIVGQAVGAMTQSRLNQLIDQVYRRLPSDTKT